MCYGLPRVCRPRRCAIAVWLVVVVTLFAAGSAPGGPPEDVLKVMAAWYVFATWNEQSRTFSLL